jgi:hypothetical protein
MASTFVPRLDELDVASALLQSAQKAVDPVARIAEDARHPPFLEPLPKEVADCRGPSAVLLQVIEVLLIAMGRTVPTIPARQRWNIRCTNLFFPCNKKVL